jgi:hypothetical protein
LSSIERIPAFLSVHFDIDDIETKRYVANNPHKTPPCVSWRKYINESIDPTNRLHRHPVLDVKLHSKPSMGRA